MMSTDKINEALVKFNYEETSIQQLAEHIGFSFFAQLFYKKWFWEPAFNGSWIYLSPEIITQDMGYKQISSFYKDTLRLKYTKDIDYSEITKDDELVKKIQHKRGSAQNHTVSIHQIYIFLLNFFLKSG
jgi:hypothetical protein